jgi:DNA polymerase-4
MDCFYAAVHVREDPRLAGRPVLVGGDPAGRGVVAAASYEARRFGVRSAMPSRTARRLCPQAVFLRPDFALYRAESEAIFAIFGDMAPRVQAVSIDEAFLDVSEGLARWGSATALARALRQRVKRERGLTVSVGVGPNKLIAKIASDVDKPDGLTVVPPARVAAFLAPLPVRVLPGVGPATAGAMGRLGIATVGDLRRWREVALLERFGRYGEALYRFARGRDDRPVRTSRGRKSLGSERTYARDLSSRDEIEAELSRLCERVARGLLDGELTGRTVSIKVRYGDYSTVTRARTLPLPTADGRVIRECALELLDRTEAGPRAVRLLGVGCSNLDPPDAGQLPLFAA